jgi:hypothetical protein
MRNLYIVGLMLMVFGAVGGTLLYFTPEYVVETSREHSFVIDADFVSVRRSLRKEDIMERILAANNGEVLEKKWVGGDFHIKHILNRELRTWTLNGKINAKVLIRETGQGEMVVDLKQDLYVTPQLISSKTRLAKPLPVGVSHLDEAIDIRPHGQNQTRVDIRLYMRFCRKIPSLYRQYACEQINRSADKQIADIEQEFRVLVAKYKRFW